MLRITSSFVCLDLFDGFAQFPKKLSDIASRIYAFVRVGGLCRGKEKFCGILSGLYWILYFFFDSCLSSPCLNFRLEDRN